MSVAPVLKSKHKQSKSLISAIASNNRFKAKLNNKRTSLPPIASLTVDVLMDTLGGDDRKEKDQSPSDGDEDPLNSTAFRHFYEHFEPDGLLKSDMSFAHFAKDLVPKKEPEKNKHKNLALNALEVFQSKTRSPKMLVK